MPEQLLEIIANAHVGIRSLTPYKPGRPVDEVKRLYGVDDVIKLASNENPLGASPAAVAAMQEAVADAGRYPDGSAFYLREALAEKHNCSASNITVGNGTNELLNMISRLFLSQSSSAIYSQHAFIVYRLAVLMCGAEGIEVPASNYGHDLEAIAAAVRPNTQLIYLANPNNPTGTYFGLDEFTAFMNRIPAHVAVILDEAYFDYVDSDVVFDGISLVPKFENLLVTRTFSKVYGLGGLRVGYCVASEALSDLLNRAREPFNTNIGAQAGAVAALADAEHTAKSVAVNKQGLVQLKAGVEKLGCSCIPTQGNFLAINVGDGAAVAQQLMEQGVIVRPVAEYQMSEFIRVTVGLPEENSRFLAALELLL